MGWSDTEEAFKALREKDKKLESTNATWKFGFDYKDVYNTNELYWAEHFCNRDVCAKILNNIINTDFNTQLPEEFKGKLYLRRYTPDKKDEFVNYHDIWIEYAYVIDLDLNLLQVWAYGKKIKECDLLELMPEEEFFKEPEFEENA